ncbi:cupredoxin domain-containing protein [Winogradskyella sp.]|uniref:cupredoxin domain-containing protein n=1 Tax=Winogradskyella sp. TaxID=1883156 RepID=UPI0026338354|nr:cupredoxin domain-containing protein [Winogradskyella sp.]
MKRIISILIITLSFTLTSNAQESMKKEAMMKEDTKATVVSLEQTKGEFTQKTITLAEGSYIFEISNNNVGHQVGFVLAPKSNPEAHIKTAYVTKAVDNNSKETSNITTLEKGEYVYFCPLNPTPQYTLIVE